jgi:Icc-related predicted phosphoesterase
MELEMKKPIRVVAMSDLHGTLPPSKDIPKCDLLLIAGDICGSHVVLDQSVWLHSHFKPWLENVPAQKIIGVAGNHDFIWEKAPHLVPKLPWKYLQDDFTTFQGWKIYGTPWQPRFFDWAFNLDEPDLERRWRHIPDDTDILVSHGPPQGFGDWVSRNEHVGSPSLAEKIRQIKPRLCVYGHIHPGFGVYSMPEWGTTLANVSILNDRYIWTNMPTEFILDPENRKTTALIRQIVNRKEIKTEERVILWGENETSKTKELAQGLS